MSVDLVKIVNSRGPVAEVWLSRPLKKNALTLDMLDQLVAAGRSLMGQRNLRAVVLAGHGGDFSAGLDTGELMSVATRLDELKSEMLNPEAGEVANRFQLPSLIWRQLGVPVIAAIDGVCFGAGFQVALGADFRVALPEARISILEGKWGLIPDMGISQSLPALLPADRAKDLIMTARILSGAEAHKMGLVTRLSDDPISEARRFAEALASRSPEAIRAAKTLVDRIYSGDPAAELRLEAELQAELIGSRNQVEAVAANLRKREPDYH